MLGMNAHARKPRHKRRELKRWQLAIIAAVLITISLGLAAGAAASSYESVSHLASRLGVPLAILTPGEIDGGLFAIILFDIVLTWARHPLPGLRVAARLFAAGTIVANGAAGWPNPAGVGLRIAAPALFVILVETARAVILRKQRDEDQAQARIPLLRWVLAPGQTWGIWRHYQLWQRCQIPADIMIAVVAKTKLEEKFGDDWAKEIPAGLMLRISSGIDAEAALAEVDTLTAPDPEPEPAALPVSAPEQRSPRKMSAPRQRRKSAPADEVVTAAEAFTILAANPDMNGAELARRLNVSPAHGRRLRARWRAQGQNGERSSGAADERPVSAHDERPA
jgi:hypothetical protein